MPHCTYSKPCMFTLILISVGVIALCIMVGGIIGAILAFKSTRKHDL